MSFRWDALTEADICPVCHGTGMQNACDSELGLIAYQQPSSVCTHCGGVGCIKKKGVKPIKLKFANERERLAFYDIVWCEGYEYPQCATCRRNRKRYENWNPPTFYTGFTLSSVAGKAFTEAEAGNCFVYVKDSTKGE